MCVSQIHKIPRIICLRSLVLENISKNKICLFWLACRTFFALNEEEMFQGLSMELHYTKSYSLWCVIMSIKESMDVNVWVIWKVIYLYFKVCEYSISLSPCHLSFLFSPPFFFFWSLVFINFPLLFWVINQIPFSTQHHCEPITPPEQ